MIYVASAIGRQLACFIPSAVRMRGNCPTLGFQPTLPIHPLEYRAITLALPCRCWCSLGSWNITISFGFWLGLILPCLLIVYQQHCTSTAREGHILRMASLLPTITVRMWSPRRGSWCHMCLMVLTLLARLGTRRNLGQDIIVITIAAVGYLLALAPPTSGSSTSR